jgi:two-component system NtrC family sensor kinase
VSELAWLAPAAKSLAALSRSPAADAWADLRVDPAAVLLLLRTRPREQKNAGLPSSFTLHPSSLLHGPAPAEEAMRLLDQPTGFVDWNQAALRPVYDSALATARLAERLARRSGTCDPEAAWVSGLLAPLGWLALCAIAPQTVAAALAAPSATLSLPAHLEPAGVARRLARSWDLPAWLTAVVGHLNLPASVAASLGADLPLFRVTRLAVRLATHGGGKQRVRLGPDLGLADDSFLEEDVASVPVEGGGWRLEGEESLSPPPSTLHPSPDFSWQDPREAPLLRHLLQLTAENRRLHARPLQEGMEQEIDRLHRALGEQSRTESRRLQAEKLEALAEFAAGAGHEINNPLAVISGQAQYLLGHQADWFTGEGQGAAVPALQVIVGQARRIHAVLRELMQFARPAPPAPEWVDLPTLLGEVAASLEELATQRRVRVEVQAQPQRLPIFADANQVRTALTCLVRNALEATPPEGWVRLVLAQPADAGPAEVAIEDSGPGPEPVQRPHLFDPFYSGRTSGRGRGLGLPLAWRLARQQGGDVYLDGPRPGEPTRFILTLARTARPVVEGTSAAPSDTEAGRRPGSSGETRQAG